jgi:hypothetical protein
MIVPAAPKMISAATVFFRKHVYQETGWDHPILKPAVVAVCNTITVNAQVFVKVVSITLAQADLQNRSNFAKSQQFHTSRY